MSLSLRRIRSRLGSPLYLHVSAAGHANAWTTPRLTRITRAQRVRQGLLELRRKTLRLARWSDGMVQSGEKYRLPWSRKVLSSVVIYSCSSMCVEQLYIDGEMRKRKTILLPVFESTYEQRTSID